MTADLISSYIDHVDRTRLSDHLFHLSRDPLPCRQLNVTLSGHAKNTLYEADDFIQARIENWGYTVTQEAVSVQAFRPGSSDPVPHKPFPLEHPEPDDPWFEAYNLYAKKVGRTYPDDLIIVISHKDSQSWIDHAPGAYDNAVGVVGNMEITRILADYEAEHSIWFIYCNEEHWPWTSEAAARNIAASDMNVVAALNIDGIGGRAETDIAAGRMNNVTRYTTTEGERLAALMATLNTQYRIGLRQNKYRCERPNDDDGSFIKAGIPEAVLNIGSFPYADPNYHTLDDKPEYVDLDNVRLATQLNMAAVLHLDRLSSP